MCVCVCAAVVFLVSVLEKVKHTYMFAFFKAVKGSQVVFLILNVVMKASS